VTKQLDEAPARGVRPCFVTRVQQLSFLAQTGFDQIVGKGLVMIRL
jgi:hypothetical protein